MGSCLSNFCTAGCSASAPPPAPSPTAKVICSEEGHLREYPAPISVSRVLQTEDSSASTSHSFLCNSDRLYYDEFIPALPLHDFLQPNQIYFLLPSSTLHRRLTASDMAALAVKATRALSSKSSLSRKKGRRVSPILLLPLNNQDYYNSKLDDRQEQMISKNKNEDDADTSSPGSSSSSSSSSSSVKKLQRLTSRRAKMAVRSFKLKLSTIYEGAVM